MMILLQKSNDYNVTNYDDNDITKVAPDTNEYIMLQKSLHLSIVGSQLFGWFLEDNMFIIKCFENADIACFVNFVKQNYMDKSLTFKRCLVHPVNNR